MPQLLNSMETPYQRTPTEVKAGPQAHSASNTTDKWNPFSKIKAGGL